MHPTALQMDLIPGQSFMGLLWGCMGVNHLLMGYLAGRYPKVLPRLTWEVTPGTKVNYWPMSLAPTNEESAWLAEKKPFWEKN